MYRFLQFLVVKRALALAFFKSMSSWQELVFIVIKFLFVVLDSLKTILIRPWNIFFPGNKVGL